MKKILAILLLISVMLLTGCNNATDGAKTVYTTDYIKVEQEGLKTTVYDLAAGQSYNFYKTRIKKDPEELKKRMQVKEPVNTDTLQIEIVGKVLVINSKKDNKKIWL